MKWRRGQSGNLRGRPRGSVSRSTRMKRRYGARLMRKLARLTFRKNHDAVAMGILAQKCLANVRPVAAPIKLPKANPRHLAQYGRVVLRRMARGRLSPDIARDVLSALAAQAQLVEHAEIVTRLEQLEESHQRSQSLLSAPVPSRGSHHVN